MGLQNSDKILVERSNTLYKETYGNRANINSSDLLLVDRGGTLYKCAYSDWPNANSSDLILVERGSGAGATMYKEFKSNWPTSSYADIHSANYAVPSSKLTFTYGNGNNLTTNFSVFEVQVEVTDSGSSSTGHLYIGINNTASYAYYADLPIGAVQILQSNGTSFRTNDDHNGDWNFAFGNSVEGYDEWYTTDSDQSGSVITNTALNPGDPTNGFVFYDIGTSSDSGDRKFSYTTNGTTSTNVGAAQGVNTNSYPADNSTVLPVGTENITQDSAQDDGGYIFQESSGGDRGIVWLNAPEATNGGAILTLHNGDRIRIAYYGGSNGATSSNGLQTTNCIYLRWHEEN
jgi:hypothetical protein